jgi:hypothetical protein
LLAYTLVDLRGDGVRVDSAALARLLGGRHLLTELQQILLSGDAGRFLNLGAAGQRQGEEKPEPSPHRQDLTRA